MGGKVAPNVTTPLETRFTARFPQFANANLKNIRAFSRVNNSPTAAKFSGFVAKVAIWSNALSAASTSVPIAFRAGSRFCFAVRS